MGQTEITGHCDSLMCKNGEQDVIDFASAESRRLFAHCLLPNLADMRQKLLACFGLCVDMVPMAYHRTCPNVS
jgi:hypothetical protein